MCDATGGAITMGILSAASGAMAAQEQAAHANAVARQRYLVAKQQAERNNQIATQNYNNQLRIAEQKDKVKKQDFEAQLKAYEAALQAGNMQTTLNTVESNRATAEARLKAEADNAEAMFELEESLASMIKSQGEMLATGNVGQSFLLQSEDPMRMLGRTTESIMTKLEYRDRQLGLELQGIQLDATSAEWRTYNNLPGVPIGEQASLLPYKPIKDPGPPEPIMRSSGTGVMAAVVGGVGTGFSTYNALK